MRITCGAGWFYYTSSAYIVCFSLKRIPYCMLNRKKNENGVITRVLRGEFDVQNTQLKPYFICIKLGRSRILSSSLTNRHHHYSYSSGVLLRAIFHFFVVRRRYTKIVSININNRIATIHKQVFYVYTAATKTNRTFWSRGYTGSLIININGCQLLLFD